MGHIISEDHEGSWIFVSKPRTSVSMDQNNHNNNTSLNLSGSRFRHLCDEEDSVNGSMGEDIHEDKEEESTAEASTRKEIEYEVVQHLNMTKSVPDGYEEAIDKTFSFFVNLSCSYGHISADYIFPLKKNMTKLVLNYKERFKSQNEEDSNVALEEDITEKEDPVQHCLPQ